MNTLDFSPQPVPLCCCMTYWASSSKSRYCLSPRILFPFSSHDLRNSLISFPVKTEPYWYEKIFFNSYTPSWSHLLSNFSHIPHGNKNLHLLVIVFCGIGGMVGCVGTSNVWIWWEYGLIFLIVSGAVIASTISITSLHHTDSVDTAENISHLSSGDTSTMNVSSSSPSS